jgi:hypothetical protein
MKAPRTKLSLGAAHAISDCVQSHGLVLGHRFREGLRLPLQRFAAKLPVRLSIELGEAAKFHWQAVPIIAAQLRDQPVSKMNHLTCISTVMICKLKSGKYRLYSRKKSPKTGRRRNLGTFSTRAAATKHEREVQYFKRV